MWMQIHQFYFTNDDDDDDTATLCCASESSDFLGDVSSLAQILSSFSARHLHVLSNMVPVPQKLFTFKLFPSIYLVQLKTSSVFSMTFLVASVWNVCT
jgi:hypothetical protein